MLTHRETRAATRTHHHATQRLRDAWTGPKPYTVTFGLGMPILGTLAIIYGDGVSAALSNIAAGSISRLMGAALLIGGIVTTLGIARAQEAVESIGLSILVTGCGVYGAGVLLGLGLHGAIAGGGFILITIATIRRVTTLSAAPDHKGRRER